MNTLLQEQRFDFVSSEDKAFMVAFNDEMTRLGYDFGNKIGDGYCWGKYMVIYTRTGVKSKNVYARLYLREPRIILRLFLSSIDEHRAFLESAPAHIKEVFAGPFGDCEHCHNEKKDGRCQFRKTYTLDGRLIEKCNGNTFWFFNPSAERLEDYMALFTEFYPRKSGKGNS